MSFLVTARTAPDDEGVTYVAIGDRDEVMDHAYDAGALGVSIKELP